MFLPVPAIPEEFRRSGDFAPTAFLLFPYPYPSGHVLRSMILLGAVFYLLSGNRLLRAGLVAALLGQVASRVYIGAHWTSDVVGGTLLGLAAVLRAFEKEGREWRSP